MKIGIVIQARSSSKRLPGKIFMDLNGRNSIQRILDGCKKTVYPHKIILAMPKDDQHEIERRIKAGELDAHTDDRFDLFIGTGDLNDLVDRYHKAARKHALDVIVRLTADCPMHESYAFGIDEMIAEYLQQGSTGFMGNNLLISPAPFPCGIDVEIFNYEMICWSRKHAKTQLELEHCVPLMYSEVGARIWGLRPFNNVRPHTMVSNRISDFSLDTPNDYQLLLKLTAAYDQYQDINKALENVDLGGHDKTNTSKNFRQ
jgi:spore coat polysaccharide biosynthesis protein SpsF (cytidylyltransferase family)